MTDEGCHCPNGIGSELGIIFSMEDYAGADARRQGAGVVGWRHWARAPDEDYG
jgi:hypothetical protein